MMRILKNTLLILVLLLQFGCITAKMNLQTRLMEDEAIPDIVASTPIKITSSCEDKERSICSQGAYKFKANHCTYVNISKEILEDALRRAGVQISESSEKTLDISLDKAYCRSIIGTAVVILNAETGDGKSKKFKGGKTPIGSAFENTRNFELAIRQAVQRMVNDEEIVSYIKK